MSKATKRKHVTKEVLEEFVEPTGDQFIVRVSLFELYRRIVFSPDKRWSWKQFA